METVRDCMEECRRMLETPGLISIRASRRNELVCVADTEESIVKGICYDRSTCYASLGSCV